MRNKQFSTLNCEPYHREQKKDFGVCKCHLEKFLFFTIFDLWQIAKIYILFAGFFLSLYSIHNIYPSIYTHPLLLIF